MTTHHTLNSYDIDVSHVFSARSGVGGPAPSGWYRIDLGICGPAVLVAPREGDS
jgi:hypothetical protein